MTVGDEMLITANIVNLNEEEVTVSLYAITPDPNLEIAVPERLWVLGPGENAAATIPVTAVGISDLVYVTLGIEAETSTGLQVDQLRLQTRIIPRGFPREVNFGGYIGS